MARRLPTLTTDGTKSNSSASWSIHNTLSVSLVEVMAKDCQTSAFAPDDASKPISPVKPRTNVIKSCRRNRRCRLMLIHGWTDKERSREQWLDAIFMIDLPFWMDKSLAEKAFFHLSSWVHKKGVIGFAFGKFSHSQTIYLSFLLGAHANVRPNLLAHSFNAMGSHCKSWPRWCLYPKVVWVSVLKINIISPDTCNSIKSGCFPPFFSQITRFKRGRNFTRLSDKPRPKWSGLPPWRSDLRPFWERGSQLVLEIDKKLGLPRR